MARVLVVSGSPGDEVLGCGGTLALHARRGDEIRVAVLGDGWTSRMPSHAKGIETVDLDVLETQEREALRILGVQTIEYHRYADNRFDVIPLLDLVKTVEKIKETFAPDIVYTNSPFDLGIDQERTCRAVVTAFRPLPGDNRTALYCFEVLSSTGWRAEEAARVFSPNVFVNIRETLDAKLAAFKRLSSEVRAWPHSRSSESIDHLARSRGAFAGLDAAEAFMLLREVRDVK